MSVSVPHNIKLLLPAFLTVGLLGCAQPTESILSYDAADHAKEKKQSLKALKSCFFKHYIQHENLHTPAIEIALQIRSECEFEFRHLRAIKLHYAPVPEVHSPSVSIQKDEISLVKAYVLQKRDFFSSPSELDQFKRLHPQQEATPPKHQGI